MQLRAVDAAGVADRTDRRPGINSLTAPDQQPIQMGISGHPAIGVTDQQQIAKPAQLIARIGDNAALGSPYWCALGCRDIDAVIMQPARFRPVTGNQTPEQRPRE